MSDRRRRNLAILGAAALVSVGLAAFVLKQRGDEGTPHFMPTEFLPGFAAHVKDAARIHIVSHSGAFDVVYTQAKGWTVPDRNNYPADFDEVRHTLIGLAALQTIEPKTARADWLHYIALDAPPAGGGIRMTVSDASGHVLADLIAGNMEDLGDPSGAAGLFVRRPTETQSWLARAVFVPHGELGTWLLSHVLDVDAARIKDLSVTPASGPAFMLSRAHPSDPDYALASAPKGKTVNNYLADAMPAAITGFTFGDVLAATLMDFSKASHITAHTFDGLTLNLQVVQLGNDIWAQVSAQAAPGSTSSVAQEAAAIDSRGGGWAYKLSLDKGRLLMTTLDSLTQAPPNSMGGGG